MINGIVNVLKPTGMSSHDVIGQLRRIYGMKKVGHAGTLDPLAAGVLPVYLGQATRLIEYGDSSIKTYHAEFVLGAATDTEDCAGQVVASAAVPALSFDDVNRVVQSFRGDSKQTPSRYSAINVNGVKAYKLARQQTEFTLPARDITIHDIELVAYRDGKGVLIVTCSKGTYIRSLIRDIGEALGTYGFMNYLVRVKAGIFDITKAATLEELEAASLSYVLPMDSAIDEMPKVTIKREKCAFLLQGRAVPFAGRGLCHGEVVRVYTEEQLIGIAKFDKEHHVIRPHKMFADVLRGK